MSFQFFLRCGAPSALPKVRGLELWPPWPPLKPPLRAFKGGNYLIILSIEWALTQEGRLFKGALIRGFIANGDMIVYDN